MMDRLVRHAEAKEAGGPGLHDGLVLACLVLSIEELADRITERGLEDTEAEALEAACEFREAFLATLAEILTNEEDDAVPAECQNREGLKVPADDLPEVLLSVGKPCGGIEGAAQREAAQGAPFRCLRDQTRAPGTLLRSQLLCISSFFHRGTLTPVTTTTRRTPHKIVTCSGRSG